MLSYATIDEAWRRSPPPVRRTYPRDTMKHTEPLPQLSNDPPEQLTAPVSGSEYRRLEESADNLRGEPPTAVKHEPSQYSSGPEGRAEHEVTRGTEDKASEHGSLQAPLGSETSADTAFYDVVLFGIVGVVIVMILEQFVQMGIAMQPVHAVRYP